MVSAFCPGHITCFFSPAGSAGGDILARGSLGAGIRISRGTHAEVRESSVTRFVMDGEEAELPVTRLVLEELAPGRCFEVNIRNELPCGEGFGMSAAGAIAVALCVANIVGASSERAYEAAHIAEIRGGGGLGDVSALTCLGHQPVRIREGLPPRGEVIATDVSFPALSLVVLGPKMHTGDTLSDPAVRNRISEAGRTALSDYLKSPSEFSLYSLSNSFSDACGVESKEVSAALSVLHDAGYPAAMCMLGNSIFTDAPTDVIRDLLGEDAGIYVCDSTDQPADITRKA